MTGEIYTAESIPGVFREAWREMACAMYNSYGDSVGWKSVSGQPMPDFDHVGGRVEAAWCISAYTAVRHAETHDMIPKRAKDAPDDLERRLAHHAESIKAAMANAMQPLTEAMVESAKIAEAGPLSRMRQGLAAQSFFLRVKNALVNPHPELTRARIAELAVEDADLLLAALSKEHVDE